MKPACPIENCPVKPLMRLSDTASITLMPQSITTCMTYGLSARGRAADSVASTTTVPISHRRPRTSDLLGDLPAEDAGRAHQQDHDEQHERDRITPGRREITDDHDLGDAHDQSADHRARNVADAAEHR